MQQVFNYFDSHNGFRRVLSQMAVVYARHGRTFGAISLCNVSIEEENALSAFFGYDYYNQALVRISLGDFARRLEKLFPAYGDFGGFILNYLPNSTINTSNSDPFAAAIATNLLPYYQDSRASYWLLAVAQHKCPTLKQLGEDFFVSPINVINAIGKVAAAISSLPVSGKFVPLNTFAASCIHEPHALDFNGKYGHLFIGALAYIFDSPVPQTAEESVELYAKARLLSNAALSQVMTYGLIPNCNTAHVLTLENIIQLTNINCYAKTVFVFENTLIFCTVNQQLAGKAYTALAGPANAAMCEVLHKLVKAGASVYYIGNMNYSGLNNADRLYLKLGKNFIAWRYTADSYQQMLNHHSYTLEENTDLALHNDDLASVLSLIRKTGKTGDVMALVPQLVADILELIT